MPCIADLNSLDTQNLLDDIEKHIKKYGQMFPKKQSKVDVLRLILVFHMVSQHPIKNSLEKKTCKTTSIFKEKSKICSKVFLTNQ